MYIFGDYKSLITYCRMEMTLFIDYYFRLLDYFTGNYY